MVESFAYVHARPSTINAHGKTRQVLAGKIELYLNNGWKFGRVNPKERSE